MRLDTWCGHINPKRLAAQARHDLQTLRGGRLPRSAKRAVEGMLAPYALLCSVLFNSLSYDETVCKMEVKCPATVAGQKNRRPGRAGPGICAIAHRKFSLLFRLFFMTGYMAEDCFARGKLL